MLSRLGVFGLLLLAIFNTHASIQRGQELGPLAPAIIDHGQPMAGLDDITKVLNAEPASAEIIEAAPKPEDQFDDIFAQIGLSSGQESASEEQAAVEQMEAKEELKKEMEVLGDLIKRGEDIVAAMPAKKERLEQLKSQLENTESNLENMKEQSKLQRKQALLAEVQAKIGTLEEELEKLKASEKKLMASIRLEEEAAAATTEE